MTGFAAGFVTAVVIFIALISIGHGLEKGGAEDYFKIYYERDDEWEWKIVVPKYGRVLKGPMAKDIYKWLTKGKKGGQDEQGDSI